ncbi:MAG: PorP/SprF family type IX secretion system membrane protein [Chitinophagales bacterium]
MRIIFISFILCFGNWLSHGQDLHFAQFSASPSSLNPALTGFMDGTFRANVNYRNQWFHNATFATYALSSDINIVRRNLDYDMLGVGVSFYHDIEENSGYQNTNISISGAYNVMITKRPLQYIGFGIQPSLLRKQINLMDIIYGTLYETGVNTDPLGFSEFGSFKFDLNMGMSYYGYFKEKHIFTLGFAISHITQPNFALLGNDELYRKYSGYVLTELEAGAIGYAWLKPSIYFAKQGPSIEVLPSLKARFQFYNAYNEVFLGVGAGLRMIGHSQNKAISSDLISEVQFTIESYTIGFSYDVSFSDVKKATGRNGGPELSFMVDMNFDKRRKSHPRFFKMIQF